VVLAPKKGDISQEVDAATRAVPLVGGGPPLSYAFRLPGDDSDRLVLALPKIRATPPGYPRRVGLPDKKPLGS
jgi:16S rRNA (guanine527-N7)-methyltransferase